MKTPTYPASAEGLPRFFSFCSSSSLSALWAEVEAEELP